MTRPLKVLIACEFTGTVRDAFDALGHEAWSCDLLPSVTPTNRHIQGDVRDVLYDDWDLLMVAHPPCTRLCNSGVRWLNKPPNTLREGTPAERAEFLLMNEEEKLAKMWRDLDKGAELFSELWNAPIKRIAVENPVMHKHAKARIRNYEDQAQTVQPWWFGEPAFKATSFWLKGLNPLTRTNELTPPPRGTDEHKAWSFVHLAPPGPDRWKIRSKTFDGIAHAMASQWGGDALEQERAA